MPRDFRVPSRRSGAWASSNGSCKARLSGTVHLRCRKDIDNVGSCPSTITPGASCSGDNLECPYTIESSAGACSSIAVDGAVATSCTCSGGVWSCPSCGGADAGDAEAEEAGGDATMESGSGDASTEAAVDSSSGLTDASGD